MFEKYELILNFTNVKIKHSSFLANYGPDETHLILLFNHKINIKLLSGGMLIGKLKNKMENIDMPYFVVVSVYSHVVVLMCCYKYMFV